MTAMQDALPEGQQPALRVFAMPADTNASGDIFGGWLMSQVDIAGSIVAIRRVKGRVVTVAVNEFVFLKPVFVGDLISIYGSLKREGKTSLQVAATAYAERDRGAGVCIRIAQALLTYVAIDDNRRPILIS